MKLVVNSEGVYLTKVGECFCLKKEGQKQEIAAKKVDQIIISTSTYLSLFVPIFFVSPLLSPQVKARLSEL